VAEQPMRSGGSSGATREEGHGRGCGKQRNGFVTVAIGSARETKRSYWRARELLSEKALEHRLALADEVIAVLVDERQRQRSR
jgi:four helix bundle protein